MALELQDKNFLLEIAADAVSQAQLNLSDGREITRWVNAIANGIQMLEDNWAFITWQPESKSLLILSDSNRIYSANGVCQCKAFTEGIKRRNKPFPCKHRALARLIRLYFELQEKPEVKKVARFSESSNAPYLKSGSGQVPVKVGNYRV
jgi:hypothetical protein